MSGTRIRTLLLIALVAALLGWLLLDTLQRNGSEPLPVPWTAPAALLMLAGLVLAAAREVRIWVQGKRSRPLPALTAARIAVLTTASGYVGAVLTGWYAAQALVLTPALVGNRWNRLWWALAAAAAAALLAVVGQLGQRWCRRPPDDEQDPPGGVPPEPDPR